MVSGRTVAPAERAIWGVASVLQSSMTVTGQFHKARTWATIAPTVAASLWAGMRAIGWSAMVMAGLCNEKPWDQVEGWRCAGQWPLV